MGDNETYSFYLQQMLPSTEVINFGVHGYGHDQMLIYLEEEGIRYKPDIVILGFVYQDIKRNILEFRDYPKPKFELQNGKLKLKNCPVPQLEDLMEREPYRSKFFDLLSLIYQGYREMSGLRQKEAEEITTAILDEVVRAANGIEAIVVFAYLPVNDQIINFTEEITRGEKYLSTYCKNRRVEYISVWPCFLSNARNDMKFVRGHWGPREHQIAAEAIKEYLENKVIKNSN